MKVLMKISLEQHSVVYRYGHRGPNIVSMIKKELRELLLKDGLKF